MPSIILDLRECTDEQKHLVLRVMETMAYTWAGEQRATVSPLPVDRFNYLFMMDTEERAYLLHGNYTSTDRITNLEVYDYVVPNISTWFAREAERDVAALVDIW